MAHFAFHPRCRGIVALALLTTASVAVAQGASSRDQSADPLDPQARVPAVTYQSPLQNYRRLGEDKLVPWSEANETVNRIGGWRAYAREAQQPQPAEPTPRAPVTPAPASGAAPAHGGHKTH